MVLIHPSPRYGPKLTWGTVGLRYPSPFAKSIWINGCELLTPIFAHNYLGATPNFTIPAIFTAGLFDKRPHRATPYQPSTAYLSNRYVNFNTRLFDLQGKAILARKVESRQLQGPMR